MWTCPKCKRAFKRTNQGHYCGKAPVTVEEYIKSQPPETQSYIRDLQHIILNSVPGVKERIAWSMPAYEKEGNSISFAACQNHVSLYVGIEAIEKFGSELDGFAAKKSAIYLPYHKALPSELIGAIVKWCLSA